MGSRACGALAVFIVITGLHPGGSMVSSAGAADWSITSGLSSTSSIHDNVSLRPDPLGTAVGFSNSASINITALKPTASFNLSSSASHTTYVGPGAPDNLGGYSPNLSAALQKQDKLTTYGLTASISLAPTAEVELEEDEEIRSSGDTIRAAVGATIAHQLGPRDSLSGAMSWNSASASEGRENRSLSLSGSWSHSISDLTSVGASVSRSQSSSGADDEDTVVWGFNGNIATALSPRLSVSASAGFSVVDGPGTADLFDDVDLDDGPTISGPTMSVALTYALKTTTFALTASNAISETTFGDLRQSRSFGFSVAQAVNSRANIVLAGSHSTSSGGGLESGDRTSRSLSLVYSHAITPYWNGSITYRYRDVDRDDGFARSNAGFFSLSRSLTLVP
jgi:hypothetical protein